MAKRNRDNVSDRYMFDSSSDSSDPEDSLRHEPESPVRKGVAPCEHVATVWSFEGLNRKKNQGAPPKGEPVNPIYRSTGGPCTEEEKKGGKVVTYCQLVKYVGGVKKRHDALTEEIVQLRYENEALRAQARQYRNKV